MHKYFECADVVICITPHLSNVEIMSLTAINVDMNRLKYHVIRNGKIDVAKIKRVVRTGSGDIVFVCLSDDDFRLVEALDVTYLKFSDEFRGPMTKVIPSTVSRLEFNFDFDQSVAGLIPPSVTDLKFGHRFDARIENSIPNGVVSLTFGSRFNRSIKGNIPSTVVHLHFGSDFDKPIEDHIPPSVTHLTIGSRFNRSIERCPSITHLTIVADADYFTLYDTISLRTFNKRTKKLNRSLKHRTNITHLMLETASWMHSRPYQINKIYKFYLNQLNDGLLPAVTHVTFGCLFNASVTPLPSSVKNIYFSPTFNEVLYDVPDTVETINVCSDYKRPIYDNIKERVYRYERQSSMFIGIK